MKSEPDSDPKESDKNRVGPDRFFMKDVGSLDLGILTMRDNQQKSRFQ
jgi:hypothetical protein